MTISQIDKQVTGTLTANYSEYKLSGNLRKRGAAFKVSKKIYSTDSEVGYGYMYLSQDGRYLSLMLVEKAKHSFWDFEITLPPEPTSDEKAAT